MNYGFRLLLAGYALLCVAYLITHPEPVPCTTDAECCDLNPHMPCD